MLVAITKRMERAQEEDRYRRSCTNNIFEMFTRLVRNYYLLFPFFQNAILNTKFNCQTNKSNHPTKLDKYTNQSTKILTS